jgi:hypothetical protein
MHEWGVDERKHARHETRRGRRHAFKQIEPMRAALLVVDMVPFFVNENPFARGIVPNIQRLAHAMRSAGGVVAWVRMTYALSLVVGSGCVGLWR